MGIEIGILVCARMCDVKFVVLGSSVNSCIHFILTNVISVTGQGTNEQFAVGK